MNPERLRRLLEEVAAGAVTPAAALAGLADLPFADLDFAKLDLHRELRTGHPEVVYGAGKRWEDLVPICRRFADAHGRFLVTRLAADVGQRLAAEFPGASHHERARIVALGSEAARPEGEVALLAAGTSDLPVAEEAAVCLEHFGHRVARYTDVGVAGLHRLLDRLPDLRRAQVVIAVAGMDGALAALAAGLVAAPVVAVPTSVGYGAAFSGLAPLLTMLNSCAPGVAVVNIDNGFGAAVVASRIAKAGASRP
jgi:hypothetical protein